MGRRGRDSQEFCVWTVERAQCVQFSLCKYDDMLLFGSIVLMKKLECSANTCNHCARGQE